MPRLWTCGIIVYLTSLGLLCHLQIAFAAPDGIGILHGIYSQGVRNGQLVIPRKVNHLGDHISHDLTHHWSETDDELSKRKRRRRSVDDGDSDAAALHYQLELNDETLHIELEPSHDSFIAPLMVIERHRRDLRQRQRYKHESGEHKRNGTACHYHGKIRNHAKSKVALSACDGLAGYIATKDGFYWVEPSKKHNYEPDMGHPHVIFQGGPNEISASASKLPMALKKTRRYQNNPQHRRKRGISTCGTKEPKQTTEMRIEWQKQGQVIVQGGRKTRRRGKGGRGVHGGRHNNRKNHHKIKKHRHKPSRDGGDDEKQQQKEQQRRKGKRARPKRSVSKPHHVEVLLVADESMAQFHQEVDIYLLTILNMVSSLYKDPTIGNYIQLTVVRIIILEEDMADEVDEPLHVTSQAEETLSNFCRWQRQINLKNDSNPEHHDVAILVTRKDICSGSGCMTLGVANVGGMCRPDRSCSVNEDNGITLAHTITHELGHNFGMYHDTEKTGCGHRIGPILHVMTPSFESDTTHVSWSNCSRRDITYFLDQGLGNCLDDEPSKDLPKEVEYNFSLPPGAMYKAEDQCRFQFNTTDEVQVCSREDEICSQLWCQIDNNCVTQLKSAAPGTGCGRHKWCQDKQCVMMNEKPTPLEGGWGNWSSWSECTRTCGAGISIQTRECDNPSPANGGSFCTGDRTHYKTCNTEPCPIDEPNFRAVQCSKYDNEKFRGNKYTWLPYFDPQEPCKLFCTDTDDTVIVPWGNGVLDGTPCNIGTNDMCINGICMTVGCNWIVDSNTVEDKCGVCGGNGDSCVVIKEEFFRKFNVTDGYHEVVTIPQGSRNIHVEETGPAKNFLSIGTGKKFYLNGNRTIYLPGEYTIAGSLSLYERNNNEKELLKIPGPILEDITLYVLMKGKHKNVGLQYEYTISLNSTIEPNYSWELGDWTACSATCGGGVQHRFPVCHQQHKGIVDQDDCWANANNERPQQMVRPCNEIGCPYRWYTGKWQMCTITCKKRGDPDPMKRRSVLCMDEKQDAVSDTYCAGLEQPTEFEPCGQIFPYCESEEQLDGFQQNII